MNPTWVETTARLREADKTRPFAEILDALLDEWQDEIDVSTHMHDFRFWPSGEFNERPAELNVLLDSGSLEITLFRWVDRVPLLVAGDKCQPENAHPVLEAFLSQLLAERKVASQQIRHRYIAAHWLHKLSDEPVLIYSEIDDHGNETRKIEQYLNGKFDVASKNVSTGETMLSEVTVRSLDEINSQEEFDAREISQAQFERLWAAANATRDGNEPL